MWLVVGGRGHVVDHCVSVAGASGQMGMPTRSWGWIEEVPVLGEDQVQPRPAESEQPMSQVGGRVNEAAGKLGLELQREA